MCLRVICTMFVNVRKMVSIFESKKQPRPLSLPPCEQTQRENEKTSLTSEPRPSSLSPAPSAVVHRPRPHAGERVRDAGGVRRVRDSWPTGKIDYYPRASRLAVSMETKEPISSKHSPRVPSKNTISGLGTSSMPKQEQMCSSKPSFSCTETHIAPPAGQIPENNPGSSCVSDRKCQNPVWSSLSSSVRAERGGANTHTRKPLPSDSTLLSLLLFFHSGTNSSMIAIDNKIEQAMDLVKSHLMLAVREEVEVMREQIKELSERNAELERENYILRALRDRD
ncbi:TSC22 domain family protein 1-like isoform X1 [Sinocyclocheilus grahami]|uniref:TSC22 domain family protein 1-like isoform X1 n=1 Tax=Sinocyclocheilus grahami TaxID=75366 RepID=UPI0007AD35D9|nr:PREDICTED: TSC22 domain family protein 1-like isoform X1 [Sinocyclocheilus grahami]